MDLSLCPSPSFIMSCFPAEEARELCCSATSALISKLFYAIFISVFAVVGATLGALTGAYVGAKTKIDCLRGATVGAIKGSFFSIKFFKILLIVCSSDDVATRDLLQSVRLPVSVALLSFLLSSAHALRFFGPREIHINALDSTFNQVPWNIPEWLSKESIQNIPKIRITEENVWDSSRNRISCSICLQDFLQGEVVHSLPHCHHMFHVSCIQRWLVEHKSCPLCRRSF
ncbi:RING/U-box superfamily protein [Theobroma cacao]|uniref:RING/U-box superfamily protein n=1 Tax=Theobroma cacao TaxID=3641 RepID=A0A061FDK1_THECC|nr:RING/U-box superfamily protein [Theobroma cacao]